MSPLESLTADALRAVVRTYREALEEHREAINRLNVYPVPDGDTGTNMSLTIQAVAEALDDAPADGGTDMAATCKAVSHGSLMGARGNSGVILSQILRGLSGVLSEADPVDGTALAAALDAAQEAAYGAVMNPVEGTILTVAREAAAAAGEAGNGLVEVVTAARDGAADALERTPELLPVLADAGVVDSGGTGFVLFLDALAHVVDGREIPPPPEGSAEVTAAVPAGVGGQAAGDHDHDHDHDHTDVSDLRYEVMYFLEAPDDTIPAFKDVWAGIGDSIVVVGGDGIWNCHIHTDDIGPAIEAALECGRPRQIRVTDLLEEVEEERWVRDAAAAGSADEEPPPTPVPTGVVAVCTGEGVRRIFHSLGVQQVVVGGQTMNPSTQQLLDAVEAVPADEVVILPNNKNIVPVAEQVDAQSEKSVRVVPTRGVTEGFASLLAYDPQADGATNAAGMADAAAGVVAGEITRAVRASTCDLGPIAEGDHLGIGRAGILSVAPAIEDAATGLLDELVDEDHEIVTIIEGEGATTATTRHITQWLDEHRPDVEAEIHHGDQPLYPYYFGIE